MAKNSETIKIMNIRISAIIIYAGDCDKKLLELAKQSVNWCDELILVNGTNGNFDDWRNEGLKKAKGEWVLYLDSDEEVPENLKIEICKLIGNWKLKIGNYAYAIPRRNFIFNKKFMHSGQYPDYQKRLFRKTSLKKWVGDVHEEPVFFTRGGSAFGGDGEIGHLKNPLIHHKNMTISQMIEKTNKWSEIESSLMFESNHPPMNIFRFFTAGFREFIKRFIFEKAFLDGKEGIIYGIYQIYSKLISYSKLWEKQQSTIRT